jgi:membrane protease YdiL (CAAX protease family)
MWDDDETDSEEEEWPPPSPTSFVRTALIFYGLMGCVALVWRMSSPGESILHPAAGAEPSMGVVLALGAGVAVGLIAVALSEFMTRLSELGEALADTLGQGLAGIGTADAILLALASGVAEEMFFRGALQPVVGLFWTSLAFGACHFLPRKELALWSVFAVGMGLVLGGLYEWTGQLAAPIAAHVVVNGINLPRLARRFADPANPPGDSRDSSDES